MPGAETANVWRLTAVGADGARGGWVVALLYEAGAGVSFGPVQSRTELRLCAGFEELMACCAGASVPVAVDMPMGLPDEVGFRTCDLQARGLLGERRSTIFPPPSRGLLDAADYTAARERISRLRELEPQAKSLSAQAFALAPKIREADGWLRTHPDAQEWVYECHPELSFMQLAGGTALPQKRTAHGQAQRLRLVLREFPDALDALASMVLPAGVAGLDDMLDAYAALCTARRIGAGSHVTLGGSPEEPDACGLVMRIVF